MDNGSESAKSETLTLGQSSQVSQSSFAERLVLAFGGESPHAFAKRSGVGDSTIRRYLEGSAPGLDNLLLIAKAANVTLDWLAANQGPMRPATGPHALTLQDEGALPYGFVPVPKLDIRPSAGAGSLPVQEDGEADIVAFREDWLRRIGVSPKFARLMVAQGDSMWDTINDGDLMIVDISVRDFVDEAVYVLAYGGLVRLKRLQMLRSGVLLLRSDNPKYQTEEVPPGEQPDLIIGGRVRWVGGSI